MGCKQCGAPVAGKAKFCTGVECKRARARERKRVSRSTVVALPAPLMPEACDVTGAQGVPAVYQATLEALTSANRQGTPAGQSALRLAQRLDADTMDTGSSLAALAKQHLAVLEEALKDAPRDADGVDELRRRRLQRIGIA